MLAMVQLVVLNDGRENGSKIPPNLNFVTSVILLLEPKKKGPKKA
jgi:hypothetical protein